MLTLDIWFFLIAAPAVVFAGISKGGFGSGAAFAAASILALVIEPGLALGVMLPLLMLMDISSLKPYWRKWDAGAARVLILGALPGIAFGAGVYQIVSADVFRLIIGAIALAFVGWKLASHWGFSGEQRRKFPVWLGVVFGGLAGFTSFVSHAGGPPAAVYLLSKPLTKTQFQATTVLVFWAINIAKFIPYAMLGLFTPQTGLANLMLAPFAILGVYIGVRAHQLVPDRAFFLVTYVLLTATGIKLIWDALT